MGWKKYNIEQNRVSHSKGVHEQENLSRRSLHPLGRLRRSHPPPPRSLLGAVGISCACPWHCFLVVVWPQWLDPALSEMRQLRQVGRATMTVDPLLRLCVDGPSSIAIPQAEAMIYEIYPLMLLLAKRALVWWSCMWFCSLATRVQFPKFTHDAKWLSSIYFPWGLGLVNGVVIHQE